MKSETTFIKNAEGKSETINSLVEVRDWGLVFLCESELDAYRLAYLHRNTQHGTEVKFAVGADKWQVTIYNAMGAKLKFNGAK